MNGKSHRILVLNTIAFIACFAAWMINGVLVTFLVDHSVFSWTPVQIGWLLGVPMLVGSIFRLPIGILTDKFGGKWVMGCILLFCAIPMYLLSVANNFMTFLVLSLGFGMAGSSFAAGVAYTSVWYPKERQGTALGIFGVGNAGAALTAMFAPGILNKLTDNGSNLDAWRTLPQLYAVMLVVIGIIFLIATENKKPGEIKSMYQRIKPLKELKVWRLGLYYYFVFGSIVTLAQWLIPYYVNVYSMTIVAAGFLTSAFSLPAGLVRAAGGWLSDKFGARKVLSWGFGIGAVCLFLLFPPRMEIQAPGQGILSSRPGTVSHVSDSLIMIDNIEYNIQKRETSSSEIKIRYGIHNDNEGFMSFPTSLSWHEPLVTVGEEVSKGQLIARGVTRIYFQANKWIFFSIVFLIGIMMGIGSAAVYKRIADHYPDTIGTVGGIVGVLGGLGGFFNPIIFGYLLKGSGIWTTCWMFLTVIALLCIVSMRSESVTTDK